TSVITPGGTSRVDEFSRVEEYLLVLRFGDAAVKPTGQSMLTDDETPTLREGDFWEGMVRRGVGVVRSQRPKQFYPIYLDKKTKRIVEVGEPLDLDED